MTRRAAGVLFLATDTGRVLLATRASLRRYAGTWETFGGSAEPGESPQQTAAREASEEAGVQVALGSLTPLGVVLRWGIEYHLFLARVSGEFAPQLGREHDGAAWVPPASPPAPLHPGLAAPLESPAARLTRASAPSRARREARVSARVNPRKK